MAHGHGTDGDLRTGRLGFFKKIGTNRVVEFLLNGLVDFKLLDEVHIAHPAPTDPPPSPESEPEQRQQPEGKASSD